MSETSTNSSNVKKYRIYRNKTSRLPMITEEVDKDLEYITEFIYDDEEKAANAALFHYRLETVYVGK